MMKTSCKRPLQLETTGGYGACFAKIETNF